MASCDDAARRDENVKPSNQCWPIDEYQEAIEEPCAWPPRVNVIPVIALVGD
jgi:hypothetical protein